MLCKISRICWVFKTFVKYSPLEFCTMTDVKLIGK